MQEFVISSEQDLKEFNEAVSEGLITIIERHFNHLIIDYAGETTSILIDNEYLPDINYGLDETTRLIYGKCPQTNIVNISYKDNNIHIFTETDNGIKEHKIPYKHWAISNFSSKATTTLKGNSHFKYIRKYDTFDEFLERKNDLYKYRCYLVNHIPEAFMILNGFTYFKGMTPNQVSILSFDIETSGLNPYAKNAKVFLITNTFRNRNGEIIRKTFNIDDYTDDAWMIAEWCSWVREIDPSMLVGHNITIFDIPYLKVRAGGFLNLGRDGSEIEVEKRVRQIRKDGSQSYGFNRIGIFGREICDTFFLALQYDVARKYDSYALKSIIRQEGLEKEGRTLIDASKIEKYWNDPVMKAKVITYAEEDSDDSLKLFDLMGNVKFYMSQVVPKPFQIMIESASGSQLNSVMIRSYLQEGYSIAKASDLVELKGAISFAIPGIYTNCFKIDFAQLYPSIMMTYKLYDKKKDPLKHFPAMVIYFANARQKYKQLYKETNEKHYDDLQQVAKTIANSCYGFLSANGLNYNSPENAAFITAKGRELLSFSIEWATNKPVEYWQDLFAQKTGKSTENEIEVEDE